VCCSCVAVELQLRVAVVLQLCVTILLPLCCVAVCEGRITKTHPNSGYSQFLEEELCGLLI